METKEKDSKAKSVKETISNVNKSEGTKTGGRGKKAASDEQASFQSEYETVAGQEGATMTKNTDESGTGKSKAPTRQRSSDRSSAHKPEHGTSGGSTGDTRESKGHHDDDLYSDYERGFRDGSQHAARWYNQRNFEREQNTFGEYNPAYNPTGMNTERSNDRESEPCKYGYEPARGGGQSRYEHQRYEGRNYLNRNVGYSNQGHGGDYNRGGGYFQGYSDPGHYQGARQSYPNQDNYDSNYGYDELRRNPGREEQRRGYVNPDRGGYEEGGYEYRNRPSGHDDSRGYTPEQGLTGRRDRNANRYGASPRDYDEARNREIDYGGRSNYQASGRYGGTSASRTSDRSMERRGEDRHYKKGSDAERYDDPYRDYDWSSRE